MGLAADAVEEAHAPPPRQHTHTQPGAPAWVSSRSWKVRRGFCPETAQGGSLGAAQRHRPLPRRRSGEKARCDSSSLPILGLCPPPCLHLPRASSSLSPPSSTCFSPHYLLNRFYVSCSYFTREAQWKLSPETKPSYSRAACKPWLASEGWYQAWSVAPCCCSGPWVASLRLVSWTPSPQVSRMRFVLFIFVCLSLFSKESVVIY